MPVLHWLDRSKTLNTTTQLPCRVLRADDSLSCGDKDSGNMLIQGDNLHALKALLPTYRGQVKCVFIDPPYNTKSAFEHYSDSLEHSQWLDMMVPRLELLRELLAQDGSIWVTIDDHEAHYLKVVMDEVFGRGNFVADVVWAKRVSPANDAKYFSSDYDSILVYAKSKPSWIPNRLPRTEGQNSYYKNPDNDARGAWNSITYTGNKNRNERPNLYYPITNPNTGEEIFPPDTLTWRYGKDTHKENERKNLLYWGKTGKSKIPRLKMFLANAEPIVPRTIWPFSDAGSTQTAMTEQKILFAEPFATPKPESLLQRVLHIATNPGDLVLDSFLGSGTTAAVAHKMRRRYIGIELGEHAKTHCAVRLQKVIEGEQGGISKSVNWQGGGGFRFYTLGAELFTRDGKINPEVTFADLAAYIWFVETHTPYQGQGDSPLLGVHDGTAYYLLYNGILKDKAAASGNILTAPVLAQLPSHDGPKVIYAVGSRLSPSWLAAQRIDYRHIPHKVPRAAVRQPVRRNP